MGNYICRGRFTKLICPKLSRGGGGRGGKGGGGSGGDLFIGGGKKRRLIRPAKDCLAIKGGGATGRWCCVRKFTTHFP